MTENQNEAVEAALALADSGETSKRYDAAAAVFELFNQTCIPHIWAAAEILAAEVLRLREENRELAERNQWQRDELRRCRDELESLDDFRDR